MLFKVCCGCCGCYTLFHVTPHPRTQTHTDLGHVRFVAATAGAFDEELERVVSVAEVRVYVLGEDGPVQLVRTKGAPDVEGACVLQDRTHQPHALEVCREIGEWWRIGGLIVRVVGGGCWWDGS